MCCPLAEIRRNSQPTPHSGVFLSQKSAHRETLANFEFTDKELDEETGFYYYGARYLNPKTSIWISADPAMSDYIPKAPVDDEAKKHNENLPGMGGVFNYVNFHVYHYAGNNPVKLVDPDGNQTALPFPIPWSIPLPQMGPLLPPIIIAPALEAEEPKPPTLDDPDIDMGDTKTWPKPPGEGPFVEGDTSRAKPRERGEKSLFDKGGGEWRPHRPDKHHPKGHWDYKPSANPDGDKNPQWRDVYPEEHGYPPPRFLPPSGSTEEPAT